MDDFAYLSLTSNDFTFLSAQLTLRLGPSLPNDPLGPSFVCTLCAFNVSLLFLSLSVFSPLCLLSYLNTLLCTVVLVLLGRFSIFSTIQMKVLPCNGLVKKSASMFSVGQYATLTLPFFILSVTKKILH